MTEPFRIAFDPISREQGSDLDCATLAAVTFWVEGAVATRLEDRMARTVRDSARLSILRLATWFIENWWRLRWEPESEFDSSSWRMSHTLAAAGGGYLWPRMIFSSEGDHMRVRVWPTPERSQEHVRYLAAIDSIIPMVAFEQAVDAFIEGVLARIAGLGLTVRDLQAAWQMVLSERADPIETDLRKLEALLGSDPEEVPEEILALIRRSEKEFGAEAIGEVVATSGPNRILPVLDIVRDHVKRPWNFIALPDLNGVREGLQTLRLTDAPWRRAEQLASLVREKWSIGQGPVQNDRLFEILGSDRILDASDIPFAAGVRASDQPEQFAVSCRSRYSVGRRFELVRLIADQIVAAPEDRLLPATSAKTGRQKFQRAFAREFLCPYREIKAELGDKFPSDEDMEDLAARYAVSSLLVRTSLLNKGDLLRDALVARGGLDDAA